jgi:hypothetical protein
MVGDVADFDTAYRLPKAFSKEERDRFTNKWLRTAKPLFVELY